MSIQLTEQDKERIQAAVVNAEGRTSGEIVACLMPQSDSYGMAYVRAAILFAAVAALVGFAVHRFYDGWGLAWLYTAAGITATVLFAALLGAFLAYVSPALRRAMIGTDRLRRMVKLQAYRTFVEEEVFVTDRRTGILIFVSAFEHRVEVLADEGINSVVAQDAWSSIVARMITLLREGKVADGFEQAIRQCGAILREHGLEVRRDDDNELSNELRIRDRPAD